MESKIKNVMRRFNFKGKSGSLQYWECIQVGYEWHLRVVHQLFVSTQDKKLGLENYRRRCIRNGDVLVGPVTQVDQEWLAGLAAQNRVAAYQRTSHDPDQILGQLVVPVFYYQGADKIFAGVIELVTFRPKQCYAANFNQIEYLLKAENLVTKPIAKTIKVKYREDIIMFVLPLSSGITHLWENVTMRFKEVNQKDFRVGHEGCSGSRIWISSDIDLRACIANSSSIKVFMFIEPVA